MVIPTYWGRESAVGWQEGDVVYDHPTPLDMEGTLARTLKSMEILKDRDFQLLVLACATAEDIETQVEEKVRRIVANTHPSTSLRRERSVERSGRRPCVEMFVVSHAQTRAMRRLLAKAGEEGGSDLLSLRGYANVRNMCLFVPLVMGAEEVVLVDDDEVFEDPDFMRKAREFIGGRFLGTTIDGIAGYYLNGHNSYYDQVQAEPWMAYWHRFQSKAEAFDEIIGVEKPRLKRTPFAFGGCMVIHRNLFRMVPFDPRITRGEDTDYVINARMFGFNFFLDNQLAIKHRPPPKTHPVWKRFREDIYRLLYDRSKIASQEKRPNMVLVKAADFDPYPGHFLKDDLEDKILKANLILALNYLSQGNTEACQEALQNIWLAKTDAVPQDNTFHAYLAFQRRWEQLVARASADEVWPRLQSVVTGESNLVQERGQQARRAGLDGNSAAIPI
jgi:hypothetical protein